MEIKTLNIGRLRNEEHFQFQTEFYNLVNKHKPEILGIQKQFTKYKALYIIEQGALDKIQKNSLTDDITNADVARDNTYTGFKENITSKLKLSDPTINEAANRILIVITHYGSIPRKNYKAKSAAIDDMVLELTKNYTADLKTSNTKVWVDQLKNDNTIFEDLQVERNAMEAKAIQIPMSEARAAIDISYKEIVKLVNALITVNGDTKFTLFTNELNEAIDSYNQIIKRRDGHVKDDEIDEDTPEHLDDTNNDISNNEVDNEEE